MAALVGASGSLASRLVTVRVGADRERLIALSVSAVVGVRAISQESLAALPALLSEAAPEVITAIGVLDAQTLLVLETVHIAPDSLWAQFARPETAGLEAPG